MSQPNPAELARASLKRIAELKLPPTPGNFERYYREADGPVRAAPLFDGAVRPAGVTASDGVGGGGGGAARPPERFLDPALLARLDLLVGAAVETTSGLTDELDEGGRQLETGLGRLDGADGSTAALLREIAAATREIRQVVHSSHAELLVTRRGLESVHAELAESRRLLSQDPLTGSENRRAMEGILAREIATARRNDAPLSVAMIDLDHFKAINDRHGHAAGDAALVHLTQAARALLRGHDAFVRYGGDEFVLVLPDTDLRGGTIAGERLQAVLTRQPLQHGGAQIALTLSGGVASHQPGEDGAALLARADAALYRAKREGRARIVAAP